MRKEITWKTLTGKTVTVTVELLTSKTITTEWDKFEKKICELEIKASVEGMGLVGFGTPQKATDPKHDFVVAKIGPLGINQENLNKINEAISEVKLTPEWQAKEARIAAVEAADDDYYRHQRHMEKLNEGTY